MTEKLINNYNEATLEVLRGILERISTIDHSATSADALLELDSIIRLSMIVEIENHFEIELDTSEIEPEIFDTLASLAKFIDSQIT